jgi:hypothetical protein
MSLRDPKGNRLYRKVEIKIYFPENIFPMRRLVQHAEPHKGFGPEGIDDLLLQTADRLEELYPWWEFKYIPVVSTSRTATFVFTFAGYRTEGVVAQAAVPAPMPDDNFLVLHPEDPRASDGA